MGITARYAKKETSPKRNVTYRTEGPLRARTPLQPMSRDAVDAPKPADRQHAYEAAAIEFNLATIPLIVALTAHMLPSAPDLRREENARLIVVEARRQAGWRTGATSRSQ